MASVLPPLPEVAELLYPKIHTALIAGENSMLFTAQANQTGLIVINDFGGTGLYAFSSGASDNSVIITQVVTSTIQYQFVVNLKDVYIVATSNRPNFRYSIVYF